MTSRTVHLCVNIAGLLQRRNLRGMVTDDHGRELSSKESRSWLLEQQAMGRRVLPFGDPCEGFDYQTGCPGHPVQELPGDPFGGLCREAEGRA